MKKNRRATTKSSLKPTNDRDRRASCGRPIIGRVGETASIELLNRGGIEEVARDDIGWWPKRPQSPSSLPTTATGGQVVLDRAY